MGEMERAGNRMELQQRVRRAQNGDARAFTLLLASHQNEVYAVCLRYAGNRADAEDLAQEVALKAHGHLHQLKDAARFRAWLLQIAANTCRNWLARERTAPTLTLKEVENALPLKAFIGVFVGRNGTTS